MLLLNIYIFIFYPTSNCVNLTILRTIQIICQYLIIIIVIIITKKKKITVPGLCFLKKTIGYQLTILLILCEYDQFGYNYIYNIHIYIYFFFFFFAYLKWSLS